MVGLKFRTGNYEWSFEGGLHCLLGEVPLNTLKCRPLAVNEVQHCMACVKDQHKTTTAQKTSDLYEVHYHYHYPLPNSLGYQKKMVTRGSWADTKGGWDNWGGIIVGKKASQQGPKWLVGVAVS